MSTQITQKRHEIITDDRAKIERRRVKGKGYGNVLVWCMEAGYQRSAVSIQHSAKS